MVHQNILAGWDRRVINHEVNNYRKWVRSADEYIESDRQQFLNALDEQAKQILDDEERQDFYSAYLEDQIEFRYFKRTLMNSLFVASVSLFEYRLSRICELAQRRSGNPIAITDLGRFDMDKARTYLDKLGVQVPTGNTDWNDVKRCDRIRNRVVHEGALIKSTDDAADYARRNQIIGDPTNDPSPNTDTDQQLLPLNLTRPFIEASLDTFRRLLLAVLDACDETFA
jgi:hypothetical protein